MASGWNCLRKEGEEKKILVLFCNAHTVTLRMRVHILVSCFKITVFTPDMCVCHMCMEQLRNYEDR